MAAAAAAMAAVEAATAAVEAATAAAAAAAMVAVALGATVIEKHFTLDKSAAGPDHKMSMEPSEFLAFVGLIRAAETALGRGRKEPSPEEAAMIPRIRKDAEGFQPGL